MGGVREDESAGGRGTHSRRRRPLHRLHRESGIGGAAPCALRQSRRSRECHGRHRLRHGPARQGPQDLLGQVRGDGRGRKARGEAALDEDRQRCARETSSQESREEGSLEKGSGAQSEEGESKEESAAVVVALAKPNYFTAAKAGVQRDQWIPSFAGMTVIF